MSQIKPQSQHNSFTGKRPVWFTSPAKKNWICDKLHFVVIHNQVAAQNSFKDLSKSRTKVDSADLLPYFLLIIWFISTTISVKGRYEGLGGGKKVMSYLQLPPWRRNGSFPSQQLGSTVKSDSTFRFSSHSARVQFCGTFTSPECFYSVFYFTGKCCTFCSTSQIQTSHSMTVDVTITKPCISVFF